MKLYGVFRSAVRSDTLDVDLGLREATVRAAIATLLSRPDCGELKKLLVDGDTSDPRSNTLILVSGREIAALNGLDTRLSENDELSLLPVAHGG